MTNQKWFKLAANWGRTGEMFNPRDLPIPWQIMKKMERIYSRRRQNRKLETAFVEHVAKELGKLPISHAALRRRVHSVVGASVLTSGTARGQLRHILSERKDQVEANV